MNKVLKNRKLRFLAWAGVGVSMLVSGSVLANSSEYANQLRNDGVQVIEVGEIITLVFPSDAVFAHDSANIRSSYKPVLNAAANLLRDYDKVTVNVTAYSDDVFKADQPVERKQALTERQAQVVGNYLWSKNIDARFVCAQGAGDLHPVALNHTAEGRKENRRLEVSFRFYTADSTDD